jgi:hypothetical protein
MMGDYAVCQKGSADQLLSDSHGLRRSVGDAKVGHEISDC